MWCGVWWLITSVRLGLVLSCKTLVSLLFAGFVVIRRGHTRLHSCKWGCVMQRNLHLQDVHVEASWKIMKRDSVCWALDILGGKYAFCCESYLNNNPGAVQSLFSVDKGWKVEDLDLLQRFTVAEEQSRTFPVQHDSV